MKIAINVTIVYTIFLIALGAFTRLSDSGLGCPDWPGCYGFFTPPSNSEDLDHVRKTFVNDVIHIDKAWVEMVHRYFATFLGVFVIGWCVVGWRKKPRNKPLAILGTLALIAVIVQGLFGMWTVTLKLWPQIVTLHLLGGLLVLSILVLYRVCLVRAWLLPNKQLIQCNIKQLHGIKRTTILLLSVLVVQIVLGAWLSANYAAAACYDFPMCHERWWPNQNYSEGFNIFQTIGPNYLGGQLDSPAKTAIHMAHRTWAFVVFFLVGGVLISWIKRFVFLKRYAFILLVLLCLQVAIGALNIWWELPISLAVLHNMMAAIIVAFWVNLSGWLWFKK